MPLFKNNHGKLSLIRSKDIDLEKNLQKLVETNLETIFGLKFVASEFPLEGLYADTLAYDEQNKSFVIIEYKKRRNFTVVDQGIAYLSLMLNRKSDLILRYNSRFGKILKNVDWTMSRVIFVSPSYTTYQKAMKIKDLPIELWKVTNYQNNLIEFERLETSGGESIPVKYSESLKKIKKEIKVYDEAFHLESLPDKLKRLYETIKENIQSRDGEIEFNSRRYYISLRKRKNFAFVKFQKKHIILVILLPKSKGEQLIKHYKLGTLSKSVQKYYNSPCFKVYVNNDGNLDEILNALMMAKENSIS